MPVPFIGHAGKGGRRPIVAPTSPSISMDAFPLAVGTKQITIRGTGISHVGWSVFANQPPAYPWYGGGGDNIPLVDGAAVVTVTTFALGDRVKVFKSAATGGGSARDLSVSANSEAATAPTGDPGLPGAAGPSAIHSKMGLGLNCERTFMFAHGAPAFTPQYYQYFRNQGITHIRFFTTFPQIWGIGNGNLPDRGQIQPWLDAIAASVNSGMEVTHFDCCDVIGYEHVGSTMDTFVGMCGTALAEMSLPVDRFIAGAVNEYAGGANNVYQPHRFRMNQILRDHLPNHTIVENPCNWGDPQALVYPTRPGYDGLFGTFVPWSDANSIVQIHHYFDWKLADLVTLYDDVKKWSDANGRKVFTGEYGFDGGDKGDPSLIGNWVARLEEQSKQLSIARARPTLWAVTEHSGNAWSMTDDATNTLKPALAAALPGWAARIKTLNTGTQTPDPPPPDPPPPTGGGTLNMLLRGQSNALLFADTGGFNKTRLRLQELTGRTVNIFYAWNDNDPATIWSGTPFISNNGFPGWQEAGRQERLRQFHANLSSAEKAAPFVEIWMHNEDDGKGNVSQAVWVPAVREDAGIMRGALGLSASQCRYFFLKVRYNFGNPAGVFAGMNELAADSSFNAVVSMAAWGANMDWDGVPDGSHLSSNDANNIIAPALAAELAVLYP